MPGPKKILRFSSFEFDLSNKELRKRGFRVRLAASQIRLLTLFLERSGELVTREQIAERVWSETSTIDVATGINTAINRLRTNLGDDPVDPVFIETVIGFGYRFIAVVEEIVIPEGSATVSSSPVTEPPVEDSSEGNVEKSLISPVATLTASPKASAAAASPAPHARLWWITGAAVVAVAIIAGLLLHHQVQTKQASQSKQATTQRPEARWRSVTNVRDDNKVTAEAVSPDGQMIAYADNFGVSVHLFDTGAERALAPMPAFSVHRIAWLPNNQQLLLSGSDIATHRELVRLVALNSAYTVTVAEDADLTAVSTDGANIVFTRMQGSEVWVATSTGQTPHLLATLPKRQTADFLLWSLDGKRVMIASHGDAAEHAQYESIDAPTGKLLFRQDDVDFNSAFLLPDGRLRYLTQEPSSTPRIWSVALDTTTGGFLTAPTLEHEFDNSQAVTGLSASLDGHRIAIVAERTKPEVFTASLGRPQSNAAPKLEHIEQLTHSTVDTYPHFWATDGSVLYETGNMLSGRLAVFAQRPGEAAPRRLAEMPQDAFFAQQSPDGRWVLFMTGSGPSRTIYRVPMAGGKMEQVPTTGVVGEFHCPQLIGAGCVLREALGNQALVYYALDPVRGIGKELARTPWEPNRQGDWGISPDGHSVIAAGHDTLHPCLRRVELNGTTNSAETLPYNGPGTPLGVHWTQDGRAFFVESHTANGYELVYVSHEGRSTVLHTSPLLIWAVPSPDGTKIAFPDASTGTNVWTTESIGGEIPRV